MINIFGLRIVTGKDWDELQKQVKTIADNQRKVRVHSEQVYFHVRLFMNFVMRRMPLKRHRKEAREFFPRAE